MLKKITCSKLLTGRARGPQTTFANTLTTHKGFYEAAPTTSATLLPHTDQLLSLSSLRHDLSALPSGRHSEQVQRPAHGSLLPRGQTGVSRPVSQNSTCSCLTARSASIHSPNPLPASCWESRNSWRSRDVTWRPQPSCWSSASCFLFCSFFFGAAVMWSGWSGSAATLRLHVNQPGNESH